MPSINSKPLIVLKQITKKLNGNILFEDVSLMVNEHEFVALKGPSGCGKTTLLRLISGLDEPSSGSIRINGLLANSPGIIIPPYRRDINFLFQDLALWPHLTGYAQLKFVWESTSKGVFKERVNELCADIGLTPGLLSRYPFELSRGEQQRLAIIRTVIAKHRILFFDEPLTALDQDLRKQFLRFLERLKKQRSTTVLLVSHDLMTDLIKYDRVIRFKNRTFREVRVKVNQ